MYGREGDLKRLNDDRNNPSLSRFVRQQADKAHATITSQIKDKKLMRLRTELINAARANDLEAQNKIAMQMKAHTGEDRETGL